MKYKKASFFVESIKNGIEFRNHMPFLLSHVQSVALVLRKIKLKKPHQYDLAIIGSMLPDLEHLGLLPNAHARSTEFYEYLVEKDKDYLPLALGMVGHVGYDKLIEPGYVDLKEPEALAILQKFYPMSTSIKWAAHTFVEQTMDAEVLKESPHLPKLLIRANKRLTPEHFDQVAHHLSTFFGAEKQKLLEALQTFKKVSCEHFQDARSISNLWLKCLFVMNNEHLLKEHAQSPLAKFTAALQLGWSYSQFSMSHRLWHMFSYARKKFNDHKHLRKKATAALGVELRKLARV